MYSLILNFDEKYPKLREMDYWDCMSSSRDGIIKNTGYRRDWLYYFIDDLDQFITINSPFVQKFRFEEQNEIKILLEEFKACPRYIKNDPNKKDLKFIDVSVLYKTYE